MLIADLFVSLLPLPFFSPSTISHSLFIPTSLKIKSQLNLTEKAAASIHKRNHLQTLLKSALLAEPGEEARAVVLDCCTAFYITFLWGCQSDKHLGRHKRTPGFNNIRHLFDKSPQEVGESRLSMASGILKYFGTAACSLEDVARYLRNPEAIDNLDWLAYL